MRRSQRAVRPLAASGKLWQFQCFAAFGALSRRGTNPLRSWSAVVLAQARPERMDRTDSRPLSSGSVCIREVAGAFVVAGA